MASSHKIVVLCFCLLLSSFGVIVDAGHHGMSGLFGGGHHGHGGISTLLAAGLIASLLSQDSHHEPHYHHGHHHHGHHGAYGLGSAPLPYYYGLAGQGEYTHLG